jgi:hypothetical protein
MEMTEQAHRFHDLELAAHKKDVNVSQIVRIYREKFADQPLLHLIQDINQRVGIYSNILEDIKKIPPTSDKNFDKTATEIKNKYEKLLNLVPPDNIPNPTARDIAQYVLDKIAAFGRALIEIMASYASEIRREIRIEPSVTVLYQVEVGWSPKVIYWRRRKSHKVSYRRTTMMDLV